MKRLAVVELAKVRQAIADYMQSEGCSCCGDYAGHKAHAEILGRLLRVPKYRDGSGYDFSRFISKVRP
jgi:methionine aminopeptidase